MTSTDDARWLLATALDAGDKLVTRLVDRTRNDLPLAVFHRLPDRAGTSDRTIARRDLDIILALGPPDRDVAVAAWTAAARAVLGRRGERVQVASAAVASDDLGRDPDLGSELLSRQEKTKHELLDDLVTVQWFAGGERAAAAVGYVQVPRFKAGKPFVHERPAGGTAFLVAPDLVMTAFHVVEARDRKKEPPADPADLARQVTATTVMFDYLRRDANDRPAGTPVGVVELVAADVSLDVAVLRLPAARSEAPLTFRAPALPPVTDGLGFVANVIQHPNHEPKKVGLRNNAVYEVDDRQLYYFTDTKGGSSGAPVFDDDWRVIAIHTGWDPIAGSEPLYLGRRMVFVNRGTLGQRLVALFADPSRRVALTTA